MMGFWIPEKNPIPFPTCVWIPKKIRILFQHLQDDMYLMFRESEKLPVKNAISPTKS